jgi:hypothetical protein
MGLEKDLEIVHDTIPRNTIAFAHRKTMDADIYFISNQKANKINIPLSFPIQGIQPELWDPINGQLAVPIHCSIVKGRTFIELPLEANGSIFVLFKKSYPLSSQSSSTVFSTSFMQPRNSLIMNQGWDIQLDTANGGPALKLHWNTLTDLTSSNIPSIKYYSGTIHYSSQFEFTKSNKVLISLGQVANIATVIVNGKEVGTVWTAPFSLDITNAVKTGNNKIEIIVSNTWHNRLIGDHLYPNSKITSTTAPYRLKEKLTPTGLLGDPVIQYE